MRLWNFELHYRLGKGSHVFLHPGPEYIHLWWKEKLLWSWNS